MGTLHPYWALFPEDPWGLMIENFFPGGVAPSVYAEAFALAASASMPRAGNLVMDSSLLFRTIGSMLEGGRAIMLKNLSLEAAASQIHDASRIISLSSSLSAAVGLNTSSVGSFLGSIHLSANAEQENEATLRMGLALLLSAAAELSVTSPEAILGAVLSLESAASQVQAAQIMAQCSLMLRSLALMLQRGGATLEDSFSLETSAGISSDLYVALSALLSLSAAGAMMQESSMGPLLKILGLSASADVTVDAIGQFIRLLRFESSAVLNLAMMVSMAAGFMLHGSAELALLAGFDLGASFSLDVEARMRTTVSIALRLLKNLSMDSVSGRHGQVSASLDEIIKTGKISISKKGILEIDPSPGKKTLKPS